MLVQGDKERTLLALITARAWKDTWYRQRLVNDPEAVLRDEGVKIPDGVTVSVLEDTAQVKHVSVNDGASAEEQLAKVRRHLPLALGRELRMVHSSAQARYLVLPVAPSGTDLYGASDIALMAAAAEDSGTEATYHDTTQTTEAETTEVTVTETTEVQDAETSTTVVAEAELVAT
ncbi:MAG TPA: nitrile hydratase subunit alpha [Longimicrobium sp.]|nr:nitrile hydratase subunit alpha [Longimicrobium sp.]